MYSKKQLSVSIIGAAFIALAVGGAAHAAVLGTEDFTSSGGISDIFNEFKVTLAIGPASVGPGPNASSPATNAPLFGGTSITSADVGRTFTVTQDTDPNFNNFAALLTDGKPDKVTLSLGSGSLDRAGLFLSKSGRLFGGDTDLFGNTINSVSLRLNSLTLDTPGTNPNNDGIWTDFSFDGTVTVDGQPVATPPATPVPEPTSALSVLALGAFGPGLLLRQKKKSAILTPDYFPIN